jgi:hypothetical protein
MVARLTLIFLIFLSLEVGIMLILLPWISLGIIGDWGDNYLLAVAADKTGIPALQTIVASGWVRGAVTGLGILNVLIAFWEIANFKRGVEMLEGKKPEKREPRAENRE